MGRDTGRGVCADLAFNFDKGDEGAATGGVSGRTGATEFSSRSLEGEASAALLMDIIEVVLRNASSQHGPPKKTAWSGRYYCMKLFTHNYVPDSSSAWMMSAAI